MTDRPLEPGRVVCFTSITLSYLGRARVLANTVKRFHPDWWFLTCISDLPPADFQFDPASEPFDQVVWGHDLPIPDISAWMFKHNIVELCTAVKGPLLEALLSQGVQKTVYLDPDIALFGSLDEVVRDLDLSSIVLTPHQLDPDKTEIAIFDNEVCSLQHGVYNLGFLAIRNDASGRRFTSWFADRLRSFCYDEVERGLFVDQKWCDLVPSFFENVRILRDPGYNVASWNLNQRRVTVDRVGAILANGRPLRFFHFTKLGPVGDVMTERYAGDSHAVFELWSWYKRSVRDATPPEVPVGWWHYGHFDNGDPISEADRRLFRTRADLQAAFPRPFAVGEGTYHEWLHAQRASLDGNDFAGAASR
jgi:hypothetical protein